MPSLKGLNYEQISIISKILFREGVSREMLLAESSRGINKTNLIIKELKTGDYLVTRKISSAENGKKNITYSVNPGLGYVLGMELNYTYDRLVLIDFSGRSLFQKEYPASFESTKVLETVLDHITDFIRNTGAVIGKGINGKILSIGIGLHGIIDFENNLIKRILYHGSDVYLPLKEFLEKSLPFPVFLFPPKILVPLKEYGFYLLEKKKTFINLKMGYAVNLGIFINGSFYPGVTGFAGFFGHLVVPGLEKQCYCGNKGCLRTLISYQGICSEALERLEKNSLQGMGSTSGIDLDRIKGPNYEKGVNHIIDMALRYDKFSINLLHDIGIQLGTALAPVISIINPELLIIHSNLTRAGELFTSPVSHMIRKNVNEYLLKPLKIEYTTLEPYSVAEGGAFLALKTQIGRLLQESR